MDIKKVELPELPYGYGELEPVISRKIMELHHDKHHAGYVKGANIALEKLQRYREGEIEINIRETLRDLSFHMNGHILHSIFWTNMRKAEEENEPNGEFMDVIERNFGSFKKMKEEFSNSAKGVEGVGWASLVKDSEGKLYVLNIEKHNLMHITTFTPILVLDVWEHAFYLDYLNNKAKYVEEWWKVVNWKDVEKRFLE